MPKFCPVLVNFLVIKLMCVCVVCGVHIKNVMLLIDILFDVSCRGVYQHCYLSLKLKGKPCLSTNSWVLCGTVYVKLIVYIVHVCMLVWFCGCVTVYTGVL